MANFSGEADIAELISDFSPLPEQSDSYFLPEPSSMEIPITDLQRTRMRPQGVINAARLMADAAAGRVSRRKPITVTKCPNGKWNVLDGNSTVAVAQLSGWRSIPCCVAGKESPKTDIKNS